MTEDRVPTTEVACPICYHDVDHDSPCPVGCPKCSSVPATEAGRKAVDQGWSVRTVLAIEAEAAQGAACDG